MKLSWLIPQEKKFYDLLDEYAGFARECANLLLKMFSDPASREATWKEIKALEEKGDDQLHSIVEELNETFVTPIDREDIFALASRMDDILDFMEGAAERAILFKVTHPHELLVEQTDLLFQAAKELAAAVPLLRTPGRTKELKKNIIEINRLENRGDQVSRAVLVRLFEEADPVEIIKIKEISEFVEEAVDRCEDVAVILENLMMKRA
ncbi:MAG: DUF47 family protein [bacterium]